MSEKDDTEEKYTEYESYHSNRLGVAAGLLIGLLIGMVTAASSVHWTALTPAVVVSLGVAVHAFWKLRP